MVIRIYKSVLIEAKIIHKRKSLEQHPWKIFQEVFQGFEYQTHETRTCLTACIFSCMFSQFLDAAF